ncbi:MAG: HEAT repeat domain-containing protein [Ktedonobacteraceae bacterium]
MTNDLELQIYNLRAQLHQGDDLSVLLTLLKDIEDLAAEHPIKNVYDLLEHAYYVLKEATSDTPEAAQEIIVQRLLPWLIAADQPESAGLARGMNRDTLSDWINQYPEKAREKLLHSCLDVLSEALRSKPTADLCWTISGLGYWRADLAAGLWEIIQVNDGELGDVALRALTRLGPREPERPRLLEELHRRIERRMTTPLLAALSDIADVSTIPVLGRCFEQEAGDREAAFARTLALVALSTIADKHDTDLSVQQAAWQLIVKIYTSDYDRYTFDIYLGSNIAPFCNDPRVPFNLMEWLELHPQDSERDADRRRLLCLRMSECIRPHQVEGMVPSIPRQSLALIRLDACRNSRNTGLWSTWESNLKQQAWTTLLLLGHPSTLSISLFKKAIVQEDSGFLKGKLMELLACFRWKSLPDEVLTWITEKVDVKRETAPQELPFRRGAESLARSAGTRQAFDALLASGTRFDGALLRETANALASVSVTLVRQGDSEIIEKLLETIEGGQEEDQRRAAIEALVWMASADLFPVQHLSRIVALIEDETRGVDERSRIVHILGAIPREQAPVDILVLLQQLIRSEQTAIASSAVEALVQNGAALDMPELLEKRLSFTQVKGRWTSQFSPYSTNWIVGMVVTLYHYDPERLALVMASLIEGVSAFMLPLVLRDLDEIHRAQHRALPTEVGRALLAQLEKMLGTQFTAPEELLELCAGLLPDDFGEREWEAQWEAWAPETRVALARALGQGEYTRKRVQERAIEQLLLLMGDAQYRVRREAYRSLAEVAPDILLCITAAWAHAPSMELRSRAAEALGWLVAETDQDRVTNDLTSVLASDPDLLVRQALSRSNEERRQRTWANEYLRLVRQAYRKNNKTRLSAWRYAHALGLTGDDATITELEADLATEKLPLHERQWVIWILNNTRESWKKTVEKWPKSWFAWKGQLICQRGQIRTLGNLHLNGQFFLYRGTDETSDSDNWRGIFSPDLPNMVPSGDLLTFAMSDGRGGQLTLGRLVGDMRLVERAVLR